MISGGRGEEERCGSVLDVSRSEAKEEGERGEEKEVHWREERSGGLGCTDRKKEKEWIQRQCFYLSFEW